MWNVQTWRALCGSFSLAPWSLTILTVPLFPGLFGVAHAGLAPAVAKKIKAKLMRIARYPAALRIDASALPFLRDGREALVVREKQRPPHRLGARSRMTVR